MHSTTTVEDRELEYELTIDASSYGHTDVVHQLAFAAARISLTRFEDDQRSALLMTADRAAELAVTAALRALEAAGHLVPEGKATQEWVVMSRDDRPLTPPLDADGLHTYMLDPGLRDTDRVDSIRTIVSTIPREATRPQPAPEPALVGEADF